MQTIPRKIGPQDQWLVDSTSGAIVGVKSPTATARDWAQDSFNGMPSTLSTVSERTLYIPTNAQSVVFGTLTVDSASIVEIEGTLIVAGYPT